MAVPSINSAKILDVGRLPSMPHVLLKLMQACYRDDVSFGELSDILKMDTALSSRIVALGNSPLYAQWNGVKDFNRLLIALGINTIRNIAVTSAVHQFFSQIDDDLDYCLNNFWRSSLTCAHAAKALARLTGYPSEEEAFVTGLIHKVGQLALLNYAAVSYTRILRGADSEQTLTEGEREQFGTTAPEVGAMLLGTWGLDSFLGDALLYQCEPAAALLDASPLVKLINISHKLGERGWYDGDLGQEADLLFGLGQPMLEELLAEVEATVDETAQALGVRLHSPVGKVAEENETGDRQARAELAQQVHDIALLDGIRQQLLDGKDMEAVLEIVLQNLQLLFSLPHGICFLYSPQDNQISSAAWCAAHKEAGCEFRIPLEAGRSLIADSLLQQVRLSSFDGDRADTLAVVDRQLISMLGEEGMFCLPLMADKEKAGVLVAGLSRDKYRILSGQFNLLGYFCGEAAHAVSRMQSAVDDQRETFGAERGRLLERTRVLLHEANNPLGIINNYLEILSLELGAGHKAQKQIVVLKEEIERVGNILLRIGEEPAREKTAMQQGLVDLNATIGDLVSIFKASVFAAHEITGALDLDESLQPISSNRNKLKQVLTNLLKNAVEAMPEGGRITVGTKGQVNVDGQPFVELTIRDSGPGIASGIMQNLFSPVQSTKGKEHSGLGLTIVKNLVTELSGTISCSSSGERGTEFRILLPVNREGSAKRNQP